MKDMLILLSNEERRRFADFLTQEAHTANGLAEQMEKLRGATLPMVKKLRAEALACKIVEERLRSGEEMTLRGGD